MTKKILNRAKEIEKSLEMIDKLHYIVHCPYPKMISNFKDKENGFCYDGDVVCFVSLDEQTREELKKSIYEIIDRRRNELKNELNNL